MIILTIRTDKPEAEIGLYEGTSQLAYTNWQAHRELAETLHTKIEELVASQDRTITDIEAVVVYKGPGSFTGLRIGLSVANALSYANAAPIVGIKGEEKWLERGIEKLLSGKNDKNIIPKYGAPVHITTPRK